MGSKNMANLENDVKNLGALGVAVRVNVADGRQEEVSVVIRHKLLDLQQSPRVTRVSSTTARQALPTAGSPDAPRLFYRR
jgi:hypothetical protein